MSRQHDNLRGLPDFHAMQNGKLDTEWPVFVDSKLYYEKWGLKSDSDTDANGSFGVITNEWLEQHQRGARLSMHTQADRSIVVCGAPVDRRELSRLKHKAHNWNRSDRLLGNAAIAGAEQLGYAGHVWSPVHDKDSDKVTFTWDGESQIQLPLGRANLKRGCEGAPMDMRVVCGLTLVSQESTATALENGLGSGVVMLCSMAGVFSCGFAGYTRASGMTLGGLDPFHFGHTKELMTQYLDFCGRVTAANGAEWTKEATREAMDQINGKRSADGLEWGQEQTPWCFPVYHLDCGQELADESSWHDCNTPRFWRNAACIETCKRSAEAPKTEVHCCGGTVPALGRIKVFKVNHRHKKATERGEHDFMKHLHSPVYVLCFAMLWNGKGFTVMEALHFRLLQLNGNSTIRRSDVRVWLMLMGCNRGGLEPKEVMKLYVDAVRDYQLIVARRPYRLTDYSIGDSNLRDWESVAHMIREKREDSAEVQNTVMPCLRVDRVMHSLLLSKLSLSCSSDAWIAAGQDELKRVRKYIDMGTQDVLTWKRNSRKFVEHEQSIKSVLHALLHDTLQLECYNPHVALLWQVSH